MLHLTLVFSYTELTNINYKNTFYCTKSKICAVFLAQKRAQVCSFDSLTSYFFISG